MSKRGQRGFAPNRGGQKFTLTAPSSQSQTGHASQPEPVTIANGPVTASVMKKLANRNQASGGAETSNASPQKQQRQQQQQKQDRDAATTRPLVDVIADGKGDVDKLVPILSPRQIQGLVLTWRYDALWLVVHWLALIVSIALYQQYGHECIDASLQFAPVKTFFEHLAFSTDGVELQLINAAAKRAIAMDDATLYMKVTTAWATAMAYQTIDNFVYMVATVCQQIFIFSTTTIILRFVHGKLRSAGSQSKFCIFLTGYINFIAEYEAAIFMCVFASSNWIGFESMIRIIELAAAFTVVRYAWIGFLDIHSKMTKRV